MDFIDFLAGCWYILPLFFGLLIVGSVLGGIWMTRNNALGLQKDDWMLGYIISHGIILCIMLSGALIFYALFEIGLISSEEVRFFFPE